MSPPTYLARVRNGRLVLDEPTDLPDGEVVELVEADEDPELLAELDASIAEVERGETVSFDDVIATVRAAR